jgi:hypothetical protein
MIRIAISAEAFEALAATMPLNSVRYERERTVTAGYSSGLTSARSTS